MKLVALDIPEDSTALAAWLEQRLTGLDLGALVAELDAVHGVSAGSSETIENVLGPRRDAVLTEGLVALPREALGRLLRRPRLLLDLQELVLVEGGVHWQRLGAQAPETRVRVEQGWARLEAILRAEDRAVPGKPSIRQMPQPRRWFERPWVVSLATAAAVLVMAVAYDQTRGSVTVAQAGWGWNRPEALPQDLARGPYLEHLADDAEEWFKKRPAEPIALAKRIAEFRQGCSVLILAGHKPLPAEDRQWLIAKCRDWAAKLDAHLAAVEAGEDPLKVRAAADETIHKLISALRGRATGAA